MNYLDAQSVEMTEKPLTTIIRNGQAETYQSHDVQRLINIKNPVGFQNNWLYPTSIKLQDGTYLVTGFIKKNYGSLFSYAKLFNPVKNSW